MPALTLTLPTPTPTPTPTPPGRPRPRLHVPTPTPTADDVRGAGLRINGFPARILTWTAQEWERMPLADRPAEAGPCGSGNGVRVLLRME